MATLISYESSGGSKGRCDAKCYDAEGPECECVCGGENHRKGLQKAVDNTNKLAQTWVDRYKQAHQGETTIVKLPHFQIPLPWPDAAS